MRGLNWQTLTIPLISGLNQKVDSRALSPPFLSRAVDVQFDELGGVQTRKPWSLHPAGSLVDARKIVANGSEVVAFTKDTVYSLDDANNAWVAKATHLAVKVEEAPRFVTTDDQRTCDRAELSGVVVYTWEDPNAVCVWVAAIDKSTGAVILAPYRLEDASQARLVATSTRIMLFYWDESGSADTLLCLPLDPADLDTTVAAVATTISNGLTRSYDVTRYIGQDSVVGAAVVSGTLSYIAFTITAGATLATSTKVRTTTGAIAVSCAPDGTSVQVIRANGTNVQGDRLTLSSLADAATGQAIGTTSTNPANYIAAAHRSTQDSGAYRCYAFWSANGTTAPTAQFELKTNYVDTGGTIGTQSRLMWGLDVASRAVDYDGRVYFWASFYGETNFSSSSVPLGNAYALQNTWFLFRDDGHLCAKTMAGRASQHETSNWLPGLQLVDGTTGFAVCGTAKRRVPLDADAKSYTDREPRDVLFTFDSDEARRCVRLGRTMYVSGGEILQYDGQWLTEVNFHIAPWYAFAAQVVTGSLANGTYAYKPTWRWDNAQGERDRSTSSAIGTITISGGPAGVEFNNTQGIANLWVSHKFSTSTESSPRQPAIEVWRTAVDPTIDSDFFLTNSPDPGDTTNPQRYLANDNTALYAPTYQDRLADASLIDNEINPENGVLENVAPPGATVIATNDTRLFLGNVAGDPDRVWYSKQRADGEVAAFNEALVVDVPPNGGKITAIAFLNDTLVVFRERAIYVLSGDGYDNTGGGTNYGPARTVSIDVGAVNQESVALIESGLMFKSSKGWYLLNKGFQVQYVGAPISNYDDEDVVACHAIPSLHQVRICTDSRVLVLNSPAAGPLIGNVVLDPQQSQWSEWTTPNGTAPLSAFLWDGDYAVAVAGGLFTQASDYTGTDYGLDIETAWIKLTDLQSFARVRRVMALGEFESAHHLRIRIAYNYDDSYVDDMYWTPSPSVVGSPLQVKIGPSRQQCQAIKLRLTAVSSSDHADPPSGEALKLTGLSLEVGFKPGLYRRLPAAQKT